MLADETDYVIGVDTHRDEHALAVVAAATGVAGAMRRISADQAGYRTALRFGAAAASARRVWAVEGSNSYGAGLACFLKASGETVVEISRPGPKPRGAGKSDELDALAAARAGLSQGRPATPRSDPTSQALRRLLVTRQGAVRARTAAINELRALIVEAPDQLRSRLRNQTRSRLVAHCRRLAQTSTQSPDQQSLVIALRSLAGRISQLEREAHALEAEITKLTKIAAPKLLEQPGVGPLAAAQILISYSQPGRIHSEAAFAKLAGTNPIPASSGQTSRHRLNRGGDRQLNRALHTIILSRLKHDPQTRAYLERRNQQGKSRRDTIRILKRYIARSLYRQLQAQPMT